MAEQQSIREKITAHAKEGSDFGFELKCFNRVLEMHRCHHDWTHMGTYTDDTTGKHREFDIRGSLWPKAELNHLLHAAIECKNISAESPLILHCSERTTDMAYLEYIETEFRAPDVDCSLKGEGFEVKDWGGTHSLYRTKKFVAKSLERISWPQKGKAKTNDSEIYDRWSQALSSAHELLARACTSQPSHLQAHGVPSKHFVLPIVAVPEDTLWTVKYNSDGSIIESAEKVKEMSYFVDRKYMLGKRQFRCSHVHFVTEPNLAEFLWTKLDIFS